MTASTRRAGMRSAAVVTVIVVLLAGIGVLALLGRGQASQTRHAQAELTTTRDQLDSAHQDLNNASNQLDSTKSQLSDSTKQAQDAEEALNQVKAAEVELMVPAMVDEQTSPDEARCVATSVVDRLGAVEILNVMMTEGSPDGVPPEVIRATLQAAAECVPGLPSA